MASPSDRRAAQRRTAKQLKAGQNPIEGFGKQARRKAATYIEPKTSRLGQNVPEVASGYALPHVLGNLSLQKPTTKHEVGFSTYGGHRETPEPMQTIGLHMPVGKVTGAQFGGLSMAAGMEENLPGKLGYTIPFGENRGLHTPVGGNEHKVVGPTQNVNQTFGGPVADFNPPALGPERAQNIAELPSVTKPLKKKFSMDYDKRPSWEQDPRPTVPAGHGETFGVPFQAMHKSGPKKNTPASVMGSTQLGKRREPTIGENLAYGIARHHSMHKNGKKLADHLAAVTSGGLPDKGRISA